jgi:uncharacterized protein (TIGR00255 family)
MLNAMYETRTPAMYSMTAFARRTCTAFDRMLVWEVKSVNHRYLENQFRVPDSVRAVEHLLRERVRKHLKRGKLDCTLRMQRSDGEQTISINHNTLAELMAAIEQIRQGVPELGGVTPMEFLRWPGVMEEQGLDEEALHEAVVTLFEQTLIELVDVRASEGARLKSAIVERLDEIGILVGELKPMCAGLASLQRERLKSRLAELDVELDSGRLEQEVALLAQRVDVAEELDRLNIHVGEVRKHIDSKGPHGRRLDFLTQELNREANTLGAKSILSEISQRAVDLKVLIEQIREQVQNVE